MGGNILNLFKELVKKELLNFEVASPQELTDALSSFAERQGNETRLAEIRVYGSGILVRQFELSNISLRELKNALKLEASEIFSLSPNEIGLDYQVFSSSEGKIKGLFIALPRMVLDEYLASFDKTDIIPVRLTANITSVIGNFLLHKKIERKSFCLLDFSKTNIINLAVFINAQCELLREIQYEQPDDAEEEVINSLKYSFGRSANKTLNAVYFSGESPDKQALISRLRGKIDVVPESQDYPEDIVSVAAYPDLFFKINLLKGYALPISLRNPILRVEKIALTVLLLLCLALGFKVIKEGLTMGNLRSSFSQAEYDYARSLQAKVNLLTHGK